MDGLRVIGFALIVVMVLVGLDYYQQDKKTNGMLSVGGYVDTINARLDLSRKERDLEQAERERQKLWEAGAKPYLPEPPEGWSRYELTQADNEAVSMVLSEFRPVPLVSSIDSPAELARLSQAGKDGMLRKLAETGTVYAKDQEVLWLDISLKPKSPRNTIAGLALGAQAAFMEGMKVEEGYAVIDGVAFMEETSNLLDSDDKSQYRAFTGRIGFDQEVVVRLHADASDATIREFMGMVDYAGLNALQPLPALVVGKGIEVPDERQPEIAAKMHELYETMQRAQLKVTQEKINKMDVASVMVNTLASSGFNAEGLVDITNGEVFENQELSQLAYIRTQDMLLKSALNETESDSTADPKTASASTLGGIFQSLMNKTAEAGESPKASEEKSSPAKVTVRKGGEGLGCATLGSSKRCSVGGN